MKDGNEMKTIILYATKHGAAGEIARRIAEKMDGADTHNLKQGGAPDLSGYDCVIIGSSIYAGMIRTEAKAFLSQNADALRSKKLGLYVCGLGTEKENEVLSAAFPEDLLRNAKAARLLGGIFDPSKAGFFERLVIKIVTKKSEYTDTIDDGKIDMFVHAMTSGREE